MAEMKSLPKHVHTSRVVWSNGRGSEEVDNDSVWEWCDCKDFIEDVHSNKVPKRLHGTMIDTQLYRRAKIIGDTFPKDKLQSGGGAPTLFAAIHKLNALSVLDIFDTDFNSLMGYARDTNEHLRNYEELFFSLVAKLTLFGDDIRLSEPLLALMLLNFSALDGSDR